MALVGISSFERNRYDTHSVMKDTTNREKDADEIDRTEVEYVSKQHWLYEGTDYVLGYIPSECNKCGDEIAEDEAGYIRDGPRANGGDGGLDEVCFWCGNEVTGFAD